MSVLEICRVSKAFGSRQIVKDISLNIPEHCIYGFIGQNGAGKTTTMKMILGLLKADEGEIKVCGKKVTFGQNETNQYIGYLPDVPEFYDFMTPMEYLIFCGKITGMKKEDAKARASELLKLVGLEYANKRIKGFSRGMKQRLGVAQALFHKPKLLICDEPTSALDPLGRKELLDILVKAREETTVLFSTHILSDVERICDKIAFLHKGEIVLQGELEEIRSRYRERDIEVEFQNEVDLGCFVESVPSYKEMDGLKVVYEKVSDKDANRMFSVLAEQMICPVKFERLEVNLEEVFLEVVKG